jgi:hypothetical protein
MEEMIAMKVEGGFSHDGRGRVDRVEGPTQVAFSESMSHALGAGALGDL